MKSHRFDALSFVAGLVATLIGLLFLLPSEPTGVVDYLLDAGAWFWPTVLLAVGVAILAPLVLGGRDQDSEETSES